MYTDIVDLREFYESGLGQAARRMIRRRIRMIWPDLRGQIVLGIGYTTPYLRPFQGEADRVVAVMPASQGVTFWPPEGPGLVALGDEADLPFGDMTIDRVLLVHGLEGTEQLRPLMREIWRVLAGGGRVLVVVPNRRGLWARADWTPFGHGFPYSASQLKQVLREAMFVPERTGHALFMPPLRSRFLLKTAPAWEEVGGRWFKAFAGVTMIEASKQIFAGVSRRTQAVPVKRRLIVPLPGGAAPAARRSAGTK
ncbi:class I SAM-dependent methyltransferase [Azospirillum thermophilum]|uniref:Methyltransferase type 11 n=1 Tax=Azospirillum thermophilum TaxID=2202148 RepID=A0A2S2CWJ7_9PROT|nr:methyltransferase domain-containing protein [Azospirillum thermophilum]AWK88903.1 methyltransferase type 11 [Azospirillum thermophilum]